MVPSPVPPAHAMRVADEQLAHLVLQTEGENLPGPLVAQGPDLPPFARAHFPACSLQLAIAPGAFLAPLALLAELPKGHMVAPLERADPSPRHDQRYSRVGGDCRLMDLSQIHRRLDRSRRPFRRRHRHRDVQLVAVFPDQLHAPHRLGKVQLEDQ